MNCPRCNEPTPWAFWNGTHRCCRDCVAAGDLDRFVEITHEKATYQELNFETGEWEVLGGEAKTR